MARRRQVGRVVSVLTNLQALRLISRSIPRIPDANRGRDVAFLALQAVTGATDRERDASLAAARRLLREAIPLEDRRAA
jgi:hypothetical protein